MRARDRRDLLLVVVTAVAVRLAFAPDRGHIVDLTTFGEWARTAASVPLERAYERTNMNYPPAALWFFELIGRAYLAVAGDDPGGVKLRIALKLPTIVFDGIGTAVVYGIARRFGAHRAALGAAVAFGWNPAVIFDTALWGQNDTITAVSALAGTWCLLGGRRIAAWLLLAFAVLNKPPALVLAPLFLAEAFGTADPRERRARLQGTATGIAAGVALAYAIALPFYTERAPLAVFGRMLAWYQIGSSLYPFTSANAFNLHALFGEFFAPDARPLLGIPQRLWGDALYAAAVIAIVVRAVRAPGGRTLLEGAFLLLLAFFITLTEMHERYLVYALTFAAPLVAVDRRYGWALLVLTVTQWLNLEYSLTYMWLESDRPAGINPRNFAPVLARLCAVANVAVDAVLLARYVSPERTVAGTAATLAYARRRLLGRPP